MIGVGIDAGSRTIKVAVTDGDRATVLGTGVLNQGVDQTGLATDLLGRVLAGAGLDPQDVDRTVATGYGRQAIEAADTTITEITCHARGVHFEHPEARTVIDVGGQDSKLLRLEPDGRVRDFAMNDRCAAGTGRFLEVVADRFGVAIEDMGRMAGEAERPAAISSMCVVFAETEIIGLLAAGEEQGNIVAGVQNAITARLAAMAGRHVVDPVFFTGGVALIPGMGQALGRALGHAVRVAERPQLTGAIGAALLAAETGTMAARSERRATP